MITVTEMPTCSQTLCLEFYSQGPSAVAYQLVTNEVWREVSSALQIMKSNLLVISSHMKIKN